MWARTVGAFFFALLAFVRAPCCEPRDSREPPALASALEDTTAGGRDAKLAAPTGGQNSAEGTTSAGPQPAVRDTTSAGPQPAVRDTTSASPQPAVRDTTSAGDTAASREPGVRPGTPASSALAALPEWRRRKSPRVAMVSSFLVPGLGQLYNERILWAAVAAGVEFYFVGEWIAEQRLTNRYRAMANADPSDTEARVLFDLHRDNRIQSTWLLAVTIALSGLQSYVDAALADFDATPLPLRLVPSTSAGPGAALQLRF